MRNPEKRRNISLVLGALSAVTLGVTLALHRGDTALGNWFGIVIASIFATLFATVATVVCHFYYQHQQRLERGEKLLAKWTMSPAEWQKFATDEVTRRAAGRGNNFKVRPRSAQTGASVLIAQDAVMVDDDFYHLGRMVGLQWLPDQPPCLEYNMVTSGKNGRVRWNIRIPVADGAEPLARLVWDYVHRPGQQPDAAAVESRLRKMRVVGLIVTVVSAPALAFAIDHVQHQYMTSAAVVALVTGFVGLPAGLFTTILSHVLLRSHLRRQAAEAANK